jgi:DNA-binding transcriptional LysR family regulator
MAITFTQLSAFLAVVRGGSVTAAAEKLVVTQPSVSAAVTALGRELGAPLLERVGRGVRPTAAAVAFAPYAADVLGLLEQGRQRAREAARVGSSTLCIAAVTTAAESFLPRVLRDFGEDHPAVELSLELGNRAQVLGALVDQEVDLAVMGRPPADARVVAETFGRNDIACIAAPFESRATQHVVHPGELADRVWLLRERGSGTRELNEHFLASHKLDPATLTLGSNAAIKQAVRAGLGVSLVSRVSVSDELASGALVELPLVDGPGARPWFVVRSALGGERPVAALFIEFLLATARADKPSLYGF